MYLFKVFIVVAIFSMGCISCQTSLESRKELVSIDSLLDAQLEMLTQQETALRKEAVIDGKTEQKVIKIRDSISWAHELDAFRQLGLVNSPIYAEKYKVEDNVPDVNSNLRILSLTSKEQIPIRFLKVYYQETHDKIRRVEASYQESNSLFSGYRDMSLEFKDLQGTLSLVKYRIKGSQKIILGDTVKFSIMGEIEYQ